MVIAGAGQAGVQAALSLREYGFQGRILLLDAENEEPYRKPPLSKAYLKGEMGETQLILRTANMLAERNVELRLGLTAVRIDRPAHSVHLSDGSAVEYKKLVLALGGANRQLPSSLPSFMYLRTRNDALRIRRSVTSETKVAIVGAGFIGLEVAASLRSLGCEVIILEKEPRPLQRIVGNEISDFISKLHKSNGVTLECNIGKLAWRELPTGKTELRFGSEQSYEADVVIVGIGIEPNTKIAEAAGLPVSNGIVVDRYLATIDPSIFAIGDCANFPEPESDEHIRIESVQSATDQARTVASNILGNTKEYRNVPWFWSDQYDVKLQIVGHMKSVSFEQVVGTGEKFSILCFQQERFVGAQSINAPSDHVASRKILETRKSVSMEALSSVNFDLAHYARQL